jgi:hypothetical protein
MKKYHRNNIKRTFLETSSRKKKKEVELRLKWIVYEIKD